MEKEFLIAEMEAFFEFHNEGIIDVNAAADKLNVRVGDIDEACEAWYAVKKGEEPSKKGVLCVGKISNAMKKL